MRTVLLLLLLAPGVAFAQAGRFLLAAGEVTLVRGAKEIRATAGTAVEAGDTIRVGPASNVQIRMSDESIISLRSNTVFRIDEYVYSGRADDASRSIFSLLKGGMRTVGGAIARQQTDPLLRTAARPEAAPAVSDEKEPRREEGDSKLFGLIKAPLRTVAGALTPTRHAVRVPTATIGLRGTHYTLVHCDNDCFEPRRTTVASLLAQSDAAAPGLGNLAPNGTYGAVSNGRIGVVNNRDDREFGAFEFFYVASINSLVQRLIAPPGFLYDRLEAQERNRGLVSTESSATMARSGLNAESRPSETPVPPRPAPFIVTEQRLDTGALAVVPGAPGGLTPPIPPLVAPNTALLAAFAHSSGGADVEGSFVDASGLTSSGAGSSQILTAFNIPAGSTINPGRGGFVGDVGTPVNATPQHFSPNAINAYWGKWVGGTEDDLFGSTTFSISPTNNTFHYLVGPNAPPEVIAAKSGSFSMTFVGGTTPTNNIGDPLTGSVVGPLMVDFTARTLSFPATSFTFSSQPWSFPASTSPINIQPGRGAFVDNTVVGTCGPFTGCAGSARLARHGVFMGPAGDHLGVAVQARTTSGIAASMQATQLFTCAPSC